MTRAQFSDKISGRDCTLVNTYFNALAVTDTVLHLGVALTKDKFKQYKELFLKVKCDLRDSTNAAVATSLLVYDSGTGLVGTTGNMTVSDYTGAIRLLTDSSCIALSTPGLIDVNLGVLCSATAPTQGSITVLLYGIIN